MGTSIRKASSINALDASFLFGALAAFKPDGVTTLNYKALLESLAIAREQAGFRRADASIVFAAVDPNSDGQQRFLEMLRKTGFLVEEVDYRDAYLSMPPRAEETERSQPLQTLSPHIAYLLGILAEREGTEVVVVSGSFDLFNPLQDLVTQRSGKAMIAFFRSLMDQRWARHGVLDSNGKLPQTVNRLRFHDLEAHSRSVLGVELARASSPLVNTAVRGLRSI